MSGSTIPWPSFNSGIQSNAGQNPASIIDELSKAGHSPEQMQQLAAKAATPIPGGHSNAIPNRLQPNQSGFTPAPLNHNPAPVGKGNARGQGIGNAITGVLNAVTGVTIAESNKKQLQVATDYQTLLTSQNAVDQAKQILTNDPNNQAAKDAIDHNKKIMDGILSDPKTRQAIAKGTKIDFTDPKANETPDHKAVQQGQEMAKKSLSYADQFAAGTPQTMSPNVQAQAQYAQAQAEQKTQAEMTKTLGTVLSSIYRSDTMSNNVDKQQAGANARTALKSQSDYLLNIRKALESEKLVGMRYSNESKLIAQRGAQTVKDAHEIMDLKNQDPTTQLEKSTKVLSEMQRVSGAYQARLSAIDNAISSESINKKSGWDERVTELRTEKDHMTELMRQQDKTYGDTKNYFDSLKLKGGASNGPSDSNTDPDADYDESGSDDPNDPSFYDPNN